MSMGKTLGVLNRMVDEGVIRSYAIAGAVAALNYIEPFLTEDLDILVSFESQNPSGLVTLGKIIPYLGVLGYTEWKKEGLLIEGWPVQFLPAADALDVEALENAETIEDDFGTGELISTRVLSPHHIVATALRTGRHKDHARIIAFLEEGAVDLGRLRDVLERHSLRAKWRDFCTKTGQGDQFDLWSRS